MSSLRSFLDLWSTWPKVRYTFWQRFAAEQTDQLSKADRLIRHNGPFNKTRRGAQRRAERRLKLQQREALGYMAQAEAHDQIASLINWEDWEA
jgi:hypothetical protein